MHRLFLLCAAAVCIGLATGCCCGLHHGCGQPCGSPCGPYGAGFAPTYGGGGCGPGGCPSTGYAPGPYGTVQSNYPPPGANAPVAAGPVWYGPQTAALQPLPTY